MKLVGYRPDDVIDLRKQFRQALLVIRLGMAGLERGPALGRPLADRITGSCLHNLKELRPGSAGRTEMRILYVFDAQRQAVLLVAGDKSGSWNRWYGEAIKLAEDRYDRYLATPPEEIE